MMLKTTVVTLTVFMPVNEGRGNTGSRIFCDSSHFIKVSFMKIRVICALLMMCVFTQPLYHSQNVTQGQFSSRVKLVCIQIFPSSRLGCLMKDKEPSWHYYLTISIRRTDGFMLF